MTHNATSSMTHLPPQLMTSDLGSFARATIVKRKPEIIRRVLADNVYPLDIVAALQAFRDEIAHHPIAPLTEDAPDVPFWHDRLAHYPGKTWLEVPWYFAETYFYRRLLEATCYFQAGPWREQDPFAKQKREQEAAAVAQLAAVWPSIAQLPPDERFVLLLHSALWGNRADLSNFTVKESAHRALDTHTERENLLIDDTEAVLSFFHTTPKVETVVFINDNVGADSLFDLVLADFLLTEGWVQNVVFHLKNRPFFVSDAMIEDIHIVIQHLQTVHSVAVTELGDRLQHHLATDALCLTTDPFWTSYLSFHQLPPTLRADLAETDLVILKGDVNYRRLLDDRHWPHTTPIQAADADFPKPYLILRTLKGEILVNLPPGHAETLAAQDPTWLTNGKRGLIQFVT